MLWEWGKTRTIVELRRLALNTSNILPIAITFNCNWDIVESSEIEDWKNETNNIRFGFIIICRIASVIFGIDFKTMNQNMLKMKDFLDNSEYLIKNFLKYIIQIIQLKRSFNRKIKHFILFIDEAYSISLLFPKEFNQIRAATLNEYIYDKMSTTLYVSSLKVLPVMYTSSDLMIKAHRTGKLTLSSIVDDDWLMYKNEFNQLISYNVTQRVKKQLYILASIIIDIPRLSEIFGTYIKLLMKSGQLAQSYLNTATLDKIINQSINRVRSKYGFICPFPSPTILYGLFFNTDVILDNEACDLLKYTILMNTIDTFPEYSKANEIVNPVKFIPKASLIMLFLSFYKQELYINKNNNNNDFKFDVFNQNETNENNENNENNNENNENNNENNENENNQNQNAFRVRTYQTPIQETFERLMFKIFSTFENVIEVEEYSLIHSSFNKQNEQKKSDFLLKNLFSI